MNRKRFTAQQIKQHPRPFKVGELVTIEYRGECYNRVVKKVTPQKHGGQKVTFEND